ncbi:MAG: phosphomannomutase/phosphoglucomutase [bacterium]|nr:phosphomannomutase/phosphoglucomutase [bacterium]
MATDYDAIFKAYDIRGTVGDQIDADGARAIGGAFARFVASSRTPAVLVGRDMRPEGEEFATAFGEGVLDHGIDVVDVGLCATDMLYYASGSLGLPGAVFTASHNPAGYNGIKMCGAGAAPIGADTGLGAIKAMAISGPDPEAVKGTRTSRDLLDDYITHVRSFVDMDVLATLLVVVDTANGMGGLVVPAVFEGLPLVLDHLYPELDGTFPHHPADPLQPENLRDLQDRVLMLDADVGMAFDGDADRMFLVDENARPVSGSLTTAIIARTVLEGDPGATIIHNLICSRTVPEVIAEGGGTAVRTKVGHTIIKQAMAETGAVFGGEHSGHYYFRDNYRADSGLIAALVVLEALSRHPAGLSDLVSDLDRYAASGELNTKVADTASVIERVAAAYSSASQDRLDGLTVDFGDWWFNLRPSNTEPLLRLNLEAPTPDEVEQRVAEVQALIA